MTQLPPLPPTVIEPMVRRALDEDFGNSGDLTASLLVPATAKGKLMMRAREDGVIAGMQAAVMTYACLLYTSPSPRDRTRSRMPSSA